MPSEKDIQNSILEYLQLKNIFHWRQNSGAIKTERGGFYKFSSMNGIADILCLHKGKFIAIECKSPKGKQSPAQKIFQQNVEKNGGEYILARSLDDVIGIL